MDWRLAMFADDAQNKPNTFIVVSLVIISSIFIYFVISLGYPYISEIKNKNGLNAGHNTIEVEIKKNSQVLVNGEVRPGLLHIGDDYDLFRFLVAREEGITINSIKVIVHLPEGAVQQQIIPNEYTVHSFGQTSFWKPDERTIIYQTQNLSPSATFTVTTNLPPGLINFSFWQRFTDSLVNMNVYLWLLVSFIPCLVTLIYLAYLYFYYRRSKDKVLLDGQQIKQTLPEGLTPAEMALLIRNKVTYKAISATLIDLAIRKYLKINKQNGDFVLMRIRPSDENNLNLYEKILFSKIFMPEKDTSSREDIIFRVTHHVFSRKMADFYAKIYDSLTQKGYFSSNPTILHRQYQSFGIMLFLISVAGITFGVMTIIEPKLFLIFWLMMFFTSMIITKFSQYLSFETDQGYKILNQSLAFKNYLLGHKQIDLAKVGQNFFEKCLPYATALRCAEEWSKCWKTENKINTSWFTTKKSSSSIKVFTKDLLSVTDYVAKMLSYSREKTV